MKIIGILLCLVAMSPKVLSQSPKLERGPYLQMAYAMKSGEFYSRASVTIRWQTDIPCLGKVNYSPESEYELLLGSPNGVAFREETVPTRFHKIVLTDLQTDKQYRYFIAATSAQSPYGPILETSPDHFFTTPPAPGAKRKIKMWVLGDFGYFDNKGTMDYPANRQDSVITAMKDFMATNKTGPMDLWLWLGDNAYGQGRQEQYQETIFDKARARYDWMFRQTPFYATPGNHDYFDGAVDIPTREVIRATKNVHYYNVVDNFTAGEGGGEPSGTEAYYSYDYGNIHFISLDTYGYEKVGDTPPKILAKTSIQYNWLRKDLARARANKDINWVIVFTHMPPFTGGSHESDGDGDIVNIRQNLVPLLDSNKVDLVLSGHSHSYERSRLMRDHSTTSVNFDIAKHNPALGSNAQSSGRYDGTPNSCFYYKTSNPNSPNEGIIYVVNGGGGRPYRVNEDQDPSNIPLSQKLMQSYYFYSGGSMYIEVVNKRLTAKYIGANKQVQDQFTIFKDIDNFTVPETDGITRTATCECTDNLGTNSAFTHYTDNNANLLLSINKLGNNIGRVGVAPFELKLGGVQGRTNVGAFFPDNYVKADKVRTFSSNWRVMNRYFSLKPGTELTGTQQSIIRHYYKQYDAYMLFPGESDEDLVYREYLKFYKINSLTTNYNVNPVGGVHATLPGATAYNKNGIWVYDKSYDYEPAQGSPLNWKNRFIKDNVSRENHPIANTYYGEFVVGKLGGGGGIGGRGGGLNPRGFKTLISSGDRWKYFSKGIRPPDYVENSGGVNLVHSWKGGDKVLDFYNMYVTWDEGIAPFGYSPGGDDLEKSVIPSCPAELACYVANPFISPYFTSGCITSPCTERWMSYYFRKTFSAPEISNDFYKSIIINYKRDDGIIIYVNGKELTPRDPNMPAGAITETTASNDGTDLLENTWNTIVIPNDGNYFRKGSANSANTVAVELHQYRNTSSDLHFDMEIVLSPDVLTSPVRLAAEGEVKKMVPGSTLYPNPTNGIVYFTTPLTFESIKITDSRGIVLRYLSKPGVLNDLDITDLPAGVLILSNQNNGKVVNYKIVKSK